MLDLFSGIGGFALAASWVWADDLELQGFCEIDNYCQKVLKKNFPDVPIYEDITELQPEWFDDIDLLTGGFPCQDISVAGKGEGIEGERSGLWFEMLRLISGIRPRYALIENVPMLLHRGLGRVICDLASIGYDAEWQIISAADVGAPHLRKRVWILAYSEGERINGIMGNDTKKKSKNRIRTNKLDSRSEPLSHANSELWEEQRKPITTTPKHKTLGCGSWWKVEPDLGRVAHGVPHRVDRLRGLGNAIVPHCAALIMDRIKAFG